MTPELLQALLDVVLVSTLVGVTSGLRPAVALATVSWEIVFGGVQIAGTALEPLSHPVAPWLLVVIAFAEAQIEMRAAPRWRSNPSRIAIGVIVGSVTGAAFAVHGGAMTIGAAFGAFGGLAGGLLGDDAFLSLSRLFGRRSFASVAEIIVAIVVIALAFGPGIQQIAST